MSHALLVELLVLEICLEKMLGACETSSSFYDGSLQLRKVEVCCTGFGVNRRT